MRSAQVGSFQVGGGSGGVRPGGGRLRSGSAHVGSAPVEPAQTGVGSGWGPPGWRSAQVGSAQVGSPPTARRRARRAFALWERLRGAASRSGGEAPAALPAVPTGRGDCTRFRGAARTCGARVVPPGRRVSETCCSCVRGGQGGCGLLAVKNEDLLENH